MNAPDSSSWMAFRSGTSDQPIPPSTRPRSARGLDDARQPALEQPVEPLPDDGAVLEVQPHVIDKRLRRNPNIREADLAVIAQVATIDGVAVMDERYGRATAHTESVETIGTVPILTASLRNGRPTAEEAVTIVDGMIEAGWYCSTDLYTRIVRTLPSIETDDLAA